MMRAVVQPRVLFYQDHDDLRSEHLSNCARQHVCDTPLTVYEQCIEAPPNALLDFPDTNVRQHTPSAVEWGRPGAIVQHVSRVNNMRPVCNGAMHDVEAAIVEGTVVQQVVADS